MFQGRSLSVLFASMGVLVCPLCCDEEFSNQLSLRYHLLSITDNVYCPECCQRFDSILQLADHLDGMCGKAELVNNIEECMPASDMVMAEGMAEEDELKVHECDTPETEVVTEISNPGNMSSDVCEVRCPVTGCDIYDIEFLLCTYVIEQFKCCMYFPINDVNFHFQQVVKHDLKILYGGSVFGLLLLGFICFCRPSVIILHTTLISYLNYNI